MCLAFVRLVLPIMQTYMTAGDFTVGQRLKTSLKANAVAYLSLGLIAFILIIYLSVKKHMTLLVPLSRPRKNTKQTKQRNKQRNCFRPPRLVSWFFTRLPPPSPHHLLKLPPPIQLAWSLVVRVHVRVCVCCRNGLEQLAIASSNTWGLLLVVVMLGYGIVDVPRLFWRRYHTAYSLKMYRFRVGTMYHDLADAQEKVWPGSFTGRERERECVCVCVCVCVCACVCVCVCVCVRE